MDRISLLPDCLLIDIISRKQAIRTGTLSKRWKHLWPQVSNIVFMKLRPLSYSILKESINEFFSSVEKTLDQCRQLNLNKFQLHTPYYNWFGSKINKWIRYVVKCNVRELDLSLEPMERKFEFHEFFFINSCFTQLILKGCILDPCGTVCWNKLKSLSISRAKFDEDVIQNILSGSPVLETLKFERCYGYNWIAITSKSVKNFVIAGYSTDHREKNLEINAPYIVSLTITDLCFRKLLLVDVSCLVKAHFDYRKVGYNDKTNRQEEEKMLKGFMLKLGNVKEFAIGIHCAWVRLLSYWQFVSLLVVLSIPFNTTFLATLLYDCLHGYLLEAKALYL
nr:hypothetical protein [Tanacetum cinerariifolium]